MLGETAVNEYRGMWHLAHSAVSDVPSQSREDHIVTLGMYHELSGQFRRFVTFRQVEIHAGGFVARNG